MLESGIAQGAVIALALFVLRVGCSLFKSRSRPDALTPGQIDDIRIRRESAKEVTALCSTDGRLVLTLSCMGHAASNSTWTSCVLAGVALSVIIPPLGD